MKYQRFIRIIVLIILVSVVTICFTSCKNQAMSANNKGSYESTPAVVVSAASEDGTADPENKLEAGEDGVAVRYDELKTTADRSNGIDVSKWQGKIDWSAVKASGINFAIIRIGYRGEDGVIYKDVNADYNIQQADKAGLLIGVYFFSTAVTASEASEEAAWTIESIRCYPISYPVVYDCEGFMNPDSRMYGITSEQRTDIALEFTGVIDAAGYKSMVYASQSALDGGCWNVPKLESKTMIWIARYTSPTYPQLTYPGYGGKYDMWQYTDRGSVSGVPGNVDMIVAYFTAAACEPKDITSPKPPAEAPKSDEEKIYSAVDETVTAKDVVNLREGATTKSSIAGILKNGDTVKRVGIGTNGWSKLDYNGKTVYAVTSYLTTDLEYKTPEIQNEDVVDGCVFTPADDRVTAKDEVNLRNRPSTENGEIVGKLKNGEVLKRVAIGHRGWSRLIYNGETVYAVTNFLTTELEAKPEEKSDMLFTDVNDSVTAKSETNLRTAPDLNSSEVVYTLKKGEYVTRTGVSEKGWSRLMYNGQTVYAITSYLTE